MLVFFLVFCLLAGCLILAVFLLSPSRLLLPCPFVPLCFSPFLLCPAFPLPFVCHFGRFVSFGVSFWHGAIPVLVRVCGFCVFLAWFVCHSGTFFLSLSCLFFSLVAAVLWVGLWCGFALPLSCSFPASLACFLHVIGVCGVGVRPASRPLFPAFGLGRPLGWASFGGRVVARFSPGLHVFFPVSSPARWSHFVVKSCGPSFVVLVPFLVWRVAGLAGHGCRVPRFVFDALLLG